MNLAGVPGRRALLALAVPLLLSGCITEESHGRQMRHGFTDDRTVVQVITANVGGKNVFIPSTIVLTEGGGRKLSVFNTTDQPHGFAIAGLGVEVVLPPGQETVIELPTLEAHRIYQIGCQLHPAHRTATLVVEPVR